MVHTETESNKVVLRLGVEDRASLEFGELELLPICCGKAMRQRPSTDTVSDSFRTLNYFQKRKMLLDVIVYLMD